jgi:hypothetical protein
VTKKIYEEIVQKVLLDMMPNERVSNKDLSIEVINFVIQKKMEDRLPIISMAIDKILTEHLIIKSLLKAKTFEMPLMMQIIF